MPSLPPPTLEMTSEDWLCEYKRLDRELVSLHSSNQTTDATGLITLSKKLLVIDRDIVALDDALKGVKDVTTGEQRRRSDLVAGLGEQRETVGKYIAYWAKEGKKERGAGSDYRDREKLMSSKHDIPTRSGAGSDEGVFGKSPRSTGGIKPVRKFGAAKETTETLPLDSQGLLQLQGIIHITKRGIETYIQKQEDSLDVLGAIIHKQKIIGAAIGNELDLQNEILDSIDSDFDRVDAKVGILDKRLGKLVPK